jgi:hypothetical protein
MKIEIEIDERMIREEILKLADKTIRNNCTAWGVEDQIRREVNLLWNHSIQAIVNEELEKADLLRAKIVAILERKIQGQLTALMKTK